jgi:hypothetical protein
MKLTNAVLMLEAGHARGMPASGSTSPELFAVLVLHMVQTGRWERRPLERGSF